MKEHQELLEAGAELIRAIEANALARERYEASLKEVDLAQLPRPIPLSAILAFSLSTEDGEDLVSTSWLNQLKGMLGTIAERIFLVPILVNYRNKEDCDENDVAITEEIWEKYGKDRKVGDIVNWNGQQAVILENWYNPGMDGCLALASIADVDPSH